MPSSTGPEEHITEPSRPPAELGEYEPSGDLPYADDEDFPYSRPDGPARPRDAGGQAGDWPDGVLTEEAKSSARGRHCGVMLLVLTVVCCADAVW